MSEKLYRGKNKTSGKWEVGFFVNAKWYLNEKAMSVILPTDVTFYPHCEITEYNEVQPETVGRCMGITDAYGVEIFEHALVLIGNGETPHVVTYQNFAWYFKSGNAYRKPDKRAVYTVVGNIFDTPELLRGKK